MSATLRLRAAEYRRLAASWRLVSEIAFAVHCERRAEQIDAEAARLEGAS